MLPLAFSPLSNNMRPICVNYGCNEPVVYSRKNSDGTPRWRPHCSHCQSASWGKWPHRLGVSPFKTGKCSNVDGHLKFTCPIKWSKVPKDAKGMTEIDHIDGNDCNNTLDNVQEVCKLCHTEKGRRNGDFKRRHDHRRS